MSTDLRILILDERPDSILLLSEYLRKHGHHVVISSDGQEAVEAVLRHHRTNERYHLVIASLVMSRGVDGLAVLRQLRQRQVQVPFALYAAPSAVTPGITQIARQLQCRAMLEKPISLQAVHQLLESVIHPAAPGTVSMDRPTTKEQPFFGTSRIMRADGTSVASTPSPAPSHITPDPPSPALERIVRPAPTAPVAKPATSAGGHPTPLPPPAAAPLAPVTSLISRTARPSLPDPIAPELIPDTLDPPPVAPPTAGYRRPQPPTAPVAAPVANPPGGVLGTPPPTRSSTERTVRPISEGYTRRSSGLFTAPSDPNIVPPSTMPSTTTARIRRSIGGVQVENTPPVPGRVPTRLVACARCSRTFAVPIKATSYVIPCTHCGQANRVDP